MGGAIVAHGHRVPQDHPGHHREVLGHRCSAWAPEGLATPEVRRQTRGRPWKLRGLLDGLHRLRGEAPQEALRRYRISVRSASTSARHELASLVVDFDLLKFCDPLPPTN